ncbi:MAG: hypothetical protein LC796_15760 [Acidobacteria bacterium]|nr:hypothetical protein [Acidobacteriota bacterium]MCA1610582.1 hypothetical protein [Acidobacteriota bacterium]
MAIVDQIGNILNQYTGDSTPDREQARAHYDEIANAYPQDELASVIGPAVGRLDTPHLERKIEQSAQQMTPSQRGSFLGTLLGGLGSGAGLTGLLGSLGASPSVAADPASATPQDVARVATYAKENQPDLFHKAMGFYAQHPTLVKVLGTMAIASIAKNLASSGRRPGLL